MDRFSKDDFEVLMRHHQSPCISLYQPTPRQHEPVQLQMANLRKALRELEHQLHMTDSAQSRYQALIKPLWALLNDQDFWAQLGDGLAIFRSPELFRAYRLPCGFTQQLRVSEHFSLKPLLPLLTDVRFSILALSQNHIRLLTCTRDGAVVQPLPDTVPSCLADSTAIHESENLVQSHSGVSIAGGRQGVVYHGQGVGSDEPKDQLLHYCQQIDRGLREVLHQHAGPLFLAGVDSLRALYREANTFPFLMKEGIPGNPDKLRDAALYELCRPLAVSTLERQTLSRYQAASEATKVSRAVDEILLAAYAGRVHRLLLDPQVTLWGSVDPVAGTVQLEPVATEGAEDLLEVAAIQTLLHGGEVDTLEQAALPQLLPMIAILRY